MSLLHRVPLLWKVLVAPAFAVLCFLSFVGYTYRVSAQNTAELDRVRDVLFPELVATIENAELLDQITEHLSNAVDAKSASQVEGANALAQKLVHNLNVIGSKDPATAGEAAQLISEFDDYYKYSAKIVSGLIVDQMPPPGAMQAAAAKLNAYRPHAEKFRSESVGRYTDLLNHVSSMAQAAALKGAITGVLVLLLLPGIVYQISRMIVRPLRRATRIANEIAGGELGHVFERYGTDEVGQLMRSMQSMQDSLQHFMTAEIEMTQRHRAGDIDYRIDAAQLPGIYGDMAHGVNALATEHIRLSQRVVEVVERYGKGDFTEDMEQLPGKQIEITRAVECVKTSFQGVNRQVLVLVEAAVRGDFSARGSEGGFEHSFRQIVSGLNRLMEVCDTNLKDVGDRLAAIANGDLEKRPSGTQQGSFANLVRNVDRTIEGLLGIVGGIRSVTGTISTAADGIADESSELLRRSECETEHIDEIVQSIERLNVLVSQNAERARQANLLAVSATDVAQRGGTSFGDVVSTMHSIKARSREIVEIIALIDGIAFQTNILALNAAVEAARAGEHGRGFAVVATEVRNLSQRSAAAARQINQLIRETALSVDTGTQIVDSVGSTIAEIVDSSKRVHAIMADISAATVEQNSGIAQVSGAIAQVYESTQRDAAAVETTATAAHFLQQQAKALVDSVGGFKNCAAPVARPTRGEMPRLRVVGSD